VAEEDRHPARHESVDDAVQAGVEQEPCVALAQAQLQAVLQ
jgi:hypothetical protein